MDLEKRLKGIGRIEGDKEVDWGKPVGAEMGSDDYDDLSNRKRIAKSLFGILPNNERTDD